MRHRALQTELRVLYRKGAPWNLDMVDVLVRRHAASRQATAAPLQAPRCPWKADKGFAEWHVVLDHTDSADERSDTLAKRTHRNADSRMARLRGNSDAVACLTREIEAPIGGRRQ